MDGWKRKMPGEGERQSWREGGEEEAESARRGRGLVPAADGSVRSVWNSLMSMAAATGAAGVGDGEGGGGEAEEAEEAEEMRSGVGRGVQRCCWAAAWASQLGSLGGALF